MTDFNLAILKGDYYIRARQAITRFGSIARIMARGDNSELTNKQIKDLLPKMLGNIGALHRDRPDLILAAWPQIIGEKLAKMTHAVSFDKGVLYVKVGNSTLYSLLSQHERGRLIKCLREKFPSVDIKNIHFRLG